MKTIYTCFCTDVIHEGHLNIIKQAGQYGRVVVGALSDEALIRFNKFPTKSLEQRIAMYQQLEGVAQVVVQHSVMYEDIFETIKPDYVIHGDNWREGSEAAIRANVAVRLQAYGGQLIEVSYTYNEHVKKIDRQL